MTDRDIARLWSYVEKSTDGCWIWTGGTNQDGYGRMNVAGRKRSVHILAWELEHGPVPPGLEVCHACDITRCVRNDERSHLFTDTHLANIQDSVKKGRFVASRARGERNGHYTKPERTPRGETNGNAKLTLRQIEDIRARVSRGEPKKSVARSLGVSDTLVRYIVIGKLWKSQKVELPQTTIEFPGERKAP